MKRLSLDDEAVLVMLYDDTNKLVLPHLQLIENDLYPGKYIACIYDQDWYNGVITERSNENKNVYIKFMKQNNLVLTWPQILKNECWIPDVLFITNPPELQGQSGRHYKLAITDYDQILREFAAALQHLKPGKALGPDSICSELILHAGAALKSWLCDFLSSCLR